MTSNHNATASTGRASRPEHLGLPLLRESESTTMLRVGALAKRAGKTVRAMHLYEELGLLRPVGRSAGGYRLYDADAVNRVEWIGKLQDMGFSLHEIQEFLKTYEVSATAPQAMERVRQIFHEKLLETQAHIERLSRLSDELKESLAYLESCHACDTHLELPACVGCERCGHHGPAPILVAGLHMS